MSEAWFSATAGEAVIRVNDELLFITAGSGQAPEECDQLKLDHLTALAPDISWRTLDGDRDAVVAAARSLLEHSWRLHWSLHFLSVANDSQLSGRVRGEAIRALSHLLSAPGVFEIVRRLFLSVPLPKPLTASNEVRSFSPADRLFNEANKHRDAALLADEAWSYISLSSGASSAELRDMVSNTIMSGTGVAMLRALVSGDRALFERACDEMTPWMSERGAALALEWAARAFELHAASPQFGARGADDSSGSLPSVAHLTPPDESNTATATQRAPKDAHNKSRAPARDRKDRESKAGLNEYEYEVVYIARPDADDDTIKLIVSSIEEQALTFKGAIERTEAWGRRRLAYSIGEHKQGIYVLVVARGPGAMVNAIDLLLKRTPTVIRHLIVRVNDDLSLANRFAKSVAKRRSTGIRETSPKMQDEHGHNRSPGEFEPWWRPDLQH